MMHFVDIVFKSDSQRINEIEEKDMLKEEDEENEDEDYESGAFMLERPSGKDKQQPFKSIGETGFLSDEFSSASGNKIIKNRNRS